MDEIVIFGIPASVLVVTVVQLLKNRGLGDRWAPWAALGCSALIEGVLFGLGAGPGFGGPDLVGDLLYYVAGTAVIWLAATGIYHRGKDVAEMVGW